MMRLPKMEHRAPATLAEACAGIMVALEGQLPTLYPKYVEAMHRMGYSDDDLEFFHVHIVGDVPIYVAPDSADTWAHRELEQRCWA